MSFLIVFDGQFSTYVFTENPAIPRNVPAINSTARVNSHPEFHDLHQEAQYHEHGLRPEIEAKNHLAIIFLQEKLNAIPIVNQHHKVTGIVTLSDMLKFIKLNTEFFERG